MRYRAGVGGLIGLMVGMVSIPALERGLDWLGLGVLTVVLLGAAWICAKMDLEGDDNAG